MELSEVLAISGKPGLFKVITHTSNGIIVESMLDGKKFTAFSHERISSLEEISIYTEVEDLPLKDVFKKMFEHKNGEQALSHKSSNNELKDFFLEVVPDYDQDRVYVSDIKKIIQWYNLLVEKELMSFEEEEEESTDKEESKEKNTEN